jgi:hypothetical protein
MRQAGNNFLLRTTTVFWSIAAQSKACDGGIWGRMGGNVERIKPGSFYLRNGGEIYANMHLCGFDIYCLEKPLETVNM